MTADLLSIVVGPPLADEPGLGDLTLSSWFRTVCANGARPRRWFMRRSIFVLQFQKHLNLVSMR